MAPGQACKKASAMQHAARNGGSERQLPSTQPTRTKYVGALEHKARPVQCGNHQRYAFYFPPSRDTSKKNRGKGQEKGKPSWTNPGSAAETPREEESHTANNHGQHPSPSLPSASHLLSHGRVVGGSIKKLAFGGSSDTVPHMERNRFPVRATAVAVAWGGGDDKEYAQITKGNLHEPDKQFCAARSTSA